jgi:hypothetical protein
MEEKTKIKQLIREVKTDTIITVADEGIPFTRVPDANNQIFTYLRKKDLLELRQTNKALKLHVEAMPFFKDMQRKIEFHRCRIEGPRIEEKYLLKAPPVSLAQIGGLIGFVAGLASGLGYLLSYPIDSLTPTNLAIFLAILLGGCCLGRVTGGTIVAVNVVCYSGEEKDNVPLLPSRRL